jgi:Domain of unknown function (DUF4296)
MRKFFIASFFLFVFSACTDTEKVPPDIIPPKKMENILWDMLLADRYSAQYLIKDSAKINVKAEIFKLYEAVFVVNKTSKTEFVKSYKYYLNRPDLTKTIFDSLSVRANRDRQSMFKNAQ